MKNEYSEIQDNQFLKGLIEKGATHSSVFTGYSCFSKTEGFITLYPNISNLSESIEISRNDIIDCAKLTSGLGDLDGRMIVWVRKEAEVSIKRAFHANDGRLQVRVSDALTRMAENCHSNCSEGNCHSNCKLEMTVGDLLSRRAENCHSNCNEGNCHSNCRM